MLPYLAETCLAWPPALGTPSTHWLCVEKTKACLQRTDGCICP